MRFPLISSLIVPMITLCVASGLLAADAVKWSANDISGAAVAVPVNDRASVLAFVRSDQQQSTQALDQIKSANAGAVQIIVIFSGENAADQAKAIAATGKYPWRIVADPEFKSSGQLGVHVWPTTLVITAAGNQVAHMAGMTDTFAADFGSYLDFAAGKIDEAALQKKLSTHDVVTENAQQMAGSYLQTAQRFIARGELDDARRQIEQGLKLSPQDPALKFAMARVLALQNKSKEANDLLDTLPTNSIQPAQLAVVRGRALIGLNQLDQAKTTLESSLSVNPDPGEALYLLGLVYQQQKDLPKATESFKKAYESLSRKVQ